MTQLRCTLFALLGLTLAACSEDKTIVAVNYSYGEGVAIKENSDTQVHVVITQGGQKFEATFPTPLVSGSEPEELPDGGDGTGMVEIMIPDSAFFERYGDNDELSAFGGGKAELTADLMRGTTVLFTSKSTFDMREHGAVAAYAEFRIDPPEDDTSAPASSSSAAPSSSGAPTDAGSSEGSTTADAASSSDTASDAATSAPATDAATSAPATDAATAPTEAGSTGSDAATSG